MIYIVSIHMLNRDVNCSVYFCYLKEDNTLLRAVK